MAGYNYNPNPYNYIPNVYPQLSANSYVPAPQPQPPVQPQQPQGSIVWVDGEVGAKAYQLNGQMGPVALWDTNDTVIYLKSMNQMGMPNPLQKIRYQMEETPTGFITNNSGNSGETSPANDHKMQSEIDSLRNDIRELKDAVMQMKTPANPQRNQSNQRGGNQNA